MVGKIVFLLIAILRFVGDGDAFHLDDFALCDRQISLYAGQSRSVRSPYWPSGYMPGSSCRYNIDYQIIVSCKIDLFDPYDDGSCESERLFISENGDEDIIYTRPFCGTTTIDRTSLGNKLTLAYTSDYYSGVFDCTLTTVCDCGWGLNSRIVGGHQTSPNEFPSTAALNSISGNVLYCGATIVSSRYLVTAAHCLSKTYHFQTAVLVGDHDVTRGDDTDQAKICKIQSFIQHPEYSAETDLNDIGLVQTILPMTWSRGVGPVCLPFYYWDYDFSGVDVIATGWGTTEFGGRRSDYLRKVDLSVIRNDDPKCKADYSNIQSSQMCTYKDGKDTCQFDSGGGLYYSGLYGTRHFLVAQVSLGEGCANEAPSLNTRITAFMGWIEKHTGKLCRRAIQ